MPLTLIPDISQLQAIVTHPGMQFSTKATIYCAWHTSKLLAPALKALSNAQQARIKYAVEIHGTEDQKATIRTLHLTSTEAERLAKSTIAAEKEKAAEYARAMFPK